MVFIAQLKFCKLPQHGKAICVKDKEKKIFQVKCICFVLKIRYLLMQVCRSFAW